MEEGEAKTVTFFLFIFFFLSFKPLWYAPWWSLEFGSISGRPDGLVAVGGAICPPAGVPRSVSAAAAAAGSLDWK